MCSNGQNNGFKTSKSAKIDFTSNQSGRKILKLGWLSRSVENFKVMNFANFRILIFRLKYPFGVKMQNLQWKIQSLMSWSTHPT